MSFTEKQVHALGRRLNAAYIRTRHTDGRELSYIEGWHAVAEANRIFGFEGWDRETLETKCLQGRENRGTFHAVYIAKVRITVRAGGAIVIREGHGTGEAQGPSLGESHERALKMAETDATKRALATFGKPFGLALYVSPRKNLTPPISDADRRRTKQQQGPDGRYYVPRRPAAVLDPALRSSGNGTASSENAHSETKELSAPPATASTLERVAPDLTLRQPTAALVGLDVHRTTTGLLISHPKRQRNPLHLRFVMAQPCLFCGRSPSDAHHLRFAQPRAMGRKVSDEFTVPLCRTHHRQLHQSGNETEWWKSMDPGVDPLEIARGLWEQSSQGADRAGPTRNNHAGIGL